MVDVSQRVEVDKTGADDRVAAVEALVDRAGIGILTNINNVLPFVNDAGVFEDPVFLAVKGDYVAGA